MYVAVGGAFAWLVYSTCAVAIPMILDRDTDAVTAGIASLHAATTHTGPMLLWAALLVVLLVAAFVTPSAAGLVVIGPWLGHASWHAYRGCYGRAGQAAEPVAA